MIEYRITLPQGQWTYASNGIDLDRVLTDLVERGCDISQCRINTLPQRAPTGALPQAMTDSAASHL